MSRPLRIALIVAGVVLFAGVSVLLARLLTGGNAERDEVIAVVVDQVRGDTEAVLDRLEGCRDRPRCRRQIDANVARLRSSSPAKILRIDSETRTALEEERGLARVAWINEGRREPVIQCVLVDREGDLLSSQSVTLLAMSAPIGREEGCRPRDVTGLAR